MSHDIRSRDLKLVNAIIPTGRERAISFARNKYEHEKKTKKMKGKIKRRETGCVQIRHHATTSGS